MSEIEEEIYSEEDYLIHLPFISVLGFNIVVGAAKAGPHFEQNLKKHNLAHKWQMNEDSQKIKLPRPHNSTIFGIHEEAYAKRCTTLIPNSVQLLGTA